MKKTMAILTVSAVMCFVIGVTGALSAQKANQANYFSANGVITAIDTTAGTITVALNGTSRLLKDFNGKEQILTVTDSTLIMGHKSDMGNMMGTGGMMNGTGMMGSGGMMNGAGMMGPGAGHSGKGGQGSGIARLTIEKLKVDDNVHIKGYQNEAGDYILTMIMVWLS